MVLKLEDNIEYVARETEATAARTTSWHGGDTVFGTREDVLIETLYENSGRQDNISFYSACAAFTSQKIPELTPVEDILAFYHMRQALYHGYEHIRDNRDACVKDVAEKVIEQYIPDESPEVKIIIERYLEAASRGVQYQKQDKTPPEWYVRGCKELFSNA